ncbi:MAG: OmpA family protein [Candidatus Electrothrix sp. ATG2]|nr:OmpA family protein [Candidatus Electrothrix sp. ATG2]
MSRLSEVIRGEDMMKKRLVMLFGAVVWAMLCPGSVSFAEETVKSAKDLIMELAPPPPAKPVRRTRGLVPKPVVPVKPVPKVAPRQVVSPPVVPVVPRQEVVQYPNNPPPLPVPVPKLAPPQAITQPSSDPPSAPVQEPIRQPNTPPVQVVQAPPPPSGSATLSAVQFVYDSDELLPVARRQLDELVIALRDPSLRHTRIQLIGHTDAAGSREYNRALSMRRAYSAARYLTQVHDIPSQRIIPIGMGEEHLLDPYRPLSAVNRRVEIIVVN